MMLQEMCHKCFGPEERRFQLTHGLHALAIRISDMFAQLGLRSRLQTDLEPDYGSVRLCDGSERDDMRIQSFRDRADGF